MYKVSYNSGPNCVKCDNIHNVTSIYIISANASNALRYGSHSVACKQNYICLYP